ncbi:hypothetical protein [Arthrobacter cryoconiti]|uniref:Lipoprotein n=1 Tax=Arthrobacter cryoconiti TaxID=748907 RepID=A0ABV8R5T5_9MICC|nr:hypothetical protein [Arthrobacter cryoconiti]MCC9069358.1 hypothetical protein [Arthrobacter cryoconiti]
MKKTLTTTLGSLAVIAALALSGCASDNPGPVENTASTKAPIPTVATPLQSQAPVSNEQSVASAKAAYSEYLEVLTTIAGNGGKDETPLRGIAPGLINGGRASLMFNSLDKTGSHTTGQIKYKVLDDKVSTFKPISVGDDVPFGQVDMSLCVDKSDFHTIGPNGKDSGKVGPQQMLYTAQVIWYGGRWAVSKDWLTDDKVTACNAS